MRTASSNVEWFMEAAYNTLVIPVYITCLYYFCKGSSNHATLPLLRLASFGKQISGLTHPYTVGERQENKIWTEQVWVSRKGRWGKDGADTAARGQTGRLWWLGAVRLQQCDKPPPEPSLPAWGLRWATTAFSLEGGLPTSVSVWGDWAVDRAGRNVQCGEGRCGLSSLLALLMARGGGTLLLWPAVKLHCWEMPGISQSPPGPGHFSELPGRTLASSVSWSRLVCTQKQKAGFSHCGARKRPFSPPSSDLIHLQELLLWEETKSTRRAVPESPANQLTTQKQALYLCWQYLLWSSQKARVFWSRRYPFRDKYSARTAI